jgi:serine protease AprX
MAPWSSYGVTQDGHAKPDVVAPGRYITSTLAGSGSVLAQQFPDRIVDGTYLWLSGTSMAAAVVSGLSALAFEQHPEWTNDQVKWLLLNTSTRLGATRSHPAGYPGQGAGEVDAKAVVLYNATPKYANQGVAISAQLVGPNGATTYSNTSSSTWSSSTWSSSTWSSSTWSSSTWSSSTWSSSTWSSSTWSSSTWSSAPVQ